MAKKKRRRNQTKNRKRERGRGRRKRATMSVSGTKLMADVIEWLRYWFISFIDFNDGKKREKSNKK